MNEFNKAMNSIIEGIENGSYSADEIAVIAKNACKSLAEANDSINDYAKEDYYGRIAPADCFEDEVKDCSGWVYEYVDER